ncbi:MAG: hypothetical protein WCG25_03865 [bacterium]
MLFQLNILNTQRSESFNIFPLATPLQFDLFTILFPSNSRRNGSTSHFCTDRVVLIHQHATAS